MTIVCSITVRPRFTALKRKRLRGIAGTEPVPGGSHGGRGEDGEDPRSRGAASRQHSGDLNPHFFEGNQWNTSIFLWKTSWGRLNDMASCFLNGFFGDYNG